MHDHHNAHWHPTWHPTRYRRVPQQLNAARRHESNFNPEKAPATTSSGRQERRLRSRHPSGAAQSAAGRGHAFRVSLRDGPVVAGVNHRIDIDNNVDVEVIEESKSKHHHQRANLN